MAAPFAECPTCTADVELCSDGPDQIAVCTSCRAVWGSFKIGSGSPVVAEVEFAHG